MSRLLARTSRIVRATACGERRREVERHTRRVVVATVSPERTFDGLEEAHRFVALARAAATYASGR